MKNDKRVGILTFHDTVNYGGLFQCLAMQHVLKKSGYEPFIIDYRTSRVLKPTRFSARRLVGKVLRILNGPLGATKRKVETAKFIDRRFELSPQVFHDLNTLRQSPPPASTYIVGSDQVWNPQITSFDDAFFLDFGNKDIRRISYAASIGLDSPCTKDLEWIEKGIKKLNKVSLRESSSVSMIKDKLDVDCEAVLDPTLLVSGEEWRELAGNNHEGEYLLVYVLPGDRNVERALKLATKKISEQKNLKVIIVGDREIKRLVPNGDGRFGVGPQEFLSLLCNAKFLVTNSFHGTAFATNLGIPFVSFIPEPAANGKTRGGRLSDLAAGMGLNSRIMKPTDADLLVSADIKRLTETQDLNRAQSVLVEQRRTSTGWLEEAMLA